MAGNAIGGAKAAATNKAKYGEDFYKNIGSTGGKAKVPTKGFGFDDRTILERVLRKRKLASLAGQKGGRITRNATPRQH